MVDIKRLVSFEELSEQISQHQNFVQSDGGIGEKINLSRCLYSDIDFSGLDLTNVGFVDSKFENCNFNKCVLSDAVFQDSEFINCKFSHCFVAKVTFSGVIFQRATFEHATLNSCEFFSCQIKNTSFVRAAVNSPAFADCVIAYSDFTGTKFSDVSESVLLEDLGEGDNILAWEK